MTHQQMVNMGFQLTEEFPDKAQQYSFDSLVFIPKEGIEKVRRKEIILKVYNAGLKQGQIIGTTQRLNSLTIVKRTFLNSKQ